MNIKSGRWFFHAVFQIIYAATLIGGTLFWCGLEGRLKEPSSLTKNLGGDSWDVMSAKFDARVKTAFPLGMHVNTMAGPLKAQGFLLRDWTALLDEEHSAMRREDNFVCGQAAYVYWRNNDAGEITSVRGEYREEGCL